MTTWYLKNSKNKKKNENLGTTSKRATNFANFNEQLLASFLGIIKMLLRAKVIVEDNPNLWHQTFQNNMGSATSWKSSCVFLTVMCINVMTFDYFNDFSKQEKKLKLIILHVCTFIIIILIHIFYFNIYINFYHLDT